ncbi:MAG: ATP-binding protein [Clostridiales bacterium]|nr:ATP-binding protein [Clostridiales bacterium]
MKSFENLHLRLSCLVIFRNLLKNEVVAALLKMLEAKASCGRELMPSYARFLNLLLAENENLSEFITEKVFEDENAYIIKKAWGQSVSPKMQAALEAELGLLNDLAGLKSQDILAGLEGSDFLLHWENSQIDIKAEYLEYAKEANIKGYGIFAGRHMFRFENKAIVPIANPDPVRLSDLSGYREPRLRVLQNTKALLAGKKAANVLLYGDAGTGKSSTVKAIANEYAGEGLRLIEVSKQRLMEIPSLMEKLAFNPLKFIVFIDDLSFDQSSDEFGALKAILEGTAGVKPDNVAIYATGNRRQLVKQSFADRASDDVHAGETMQDQLALAERFGLAVGFFRPDKDEYLKIVWDLAEQYGLKNTENLELSAERFALEKGGRSGRTARQLVEYLSSFE